MALFKAKKMFKSKTKKLSLAEDKVADIFHRELYRYRLSHPQPYYDSMNDERAARLMNPAMALSRIEMGHYEEDLSRLFRFTAKDPIVILQRNREGSPYLVCNSVSEEYFIRAPHDIGFYRIYPT